MKIQHFPPWNSSMVLPTLLGRREVRMAIAGAISRYSIHSAEAINVVLEQTLSVDATIIAINFADLFAVDLSSAVQLQKRSIV
jgi:hypothetical protein